MMSNLMKENNIIHLNKYVYNNNKNQLKNQIEKNIILKRESDKNHAASSNSGSSNNLLNSQVIHKSSVDEHHSDHKEINLYNTPIERNSQDNIQINKMNVNELNEESNTQRRVIQLNFKENQRIEINKKEPNTIFSQSIHLNRENDSSHKKDSNVDNKKLTSYEKEIAHLKEMLNQKTKETKEKDKKIIFLESKIKNLQKENTTLKKEKTKNLKTQERELTKAIEKIQHLENQQNQNQELAFVDLMNRLQSNNISLNQFMGRLSEMREMDPENMYEEEAEVYDEENPNPDIMSYEQLLELQEKIGFVEKGFKIEEVDKIPIVQFDKETVKIDKCTVCQFDLIEGDTLRKLSCGHHYHKDCIDGWLLKDKKCPVCKSEVKID